MDIKILFFTLTCVKHDNYLHDLLINLWRIYWSTILSNSLKCVIVKFNLRCLNKYNFESYERVN